MADHSTRCPSCGHGVIAGWMHCPGCQRILPDTRVTPAAEHDEAPWWWPALVAGTLAFVVGVWLLWPPPPTPAGPLQAPAAVGAPAPSNRPNRPASTVGDTGIERVRALQRPGAVASTMAENAAAPPTGARRR
ncbi:MAG: hypothetical protein R2745_25775 [Vicinamibacterales bacterium]